MAAERANNKAIFQTADSQDKRKNIPKDRGQRPSRLTVEKKRQIQKRRLTKRTKKNSRKEWVPSREKTFSGKIILDPLQNPNLRVTTADNTFFLNDSIIYIMFSISLVSLQKNT